MPFATRPNFEDRQQVQYQGTSITLSGNTNIYPTGQLIILSPTLDFTGTTTASTLYNIAGLSGYINSGNISALKVQPPTLLISGSTGLTTVDITGYYLGSIDSGGTITWLAPTGGGSGTTIVDFTGNTSASCISDLYINNLHGCSPIIVHDILSGNSTINYIDLSTSPTQLQIRNDSAGNGSYLDFDSGAYYGTKLGNGPSSYLGLSYNVGTIYSSTQINLFNNNLSYTQTSGYGSAFSIGGGSGKNFIVKTNDSSGSIFSGGITGGTLQGEIVIGVPNTSVGLPLGVMGTGIGVNTTPYGVVGKDFDPVFISTPRSRSYDDSTYSSIKNILFGGGSDNSVLSGVTNSSLIGGSGNTINKNVKNVVVLGGSSITANTSNTVYVPDLVIKKSASVPTTSGDTIGEVGSITWDNNYIYVKTINGWGRTLLDYSW
jgi:hypothetical protein